MPSHRYITRDTQDLLDALVANPATEFTWDQYIDLKTLWRSVSNEFTNPNNPFKPYAILLDSLYEFGIQPPPSDWARRRKVDFMFSDLRTEQVAWLGTYSMLLSNMPRPADDPTPDEDDGDIVGLNPEVGMAPAATSSSVPAPLQADGASTGQGGQNDVDDEKEEKDEKIDGDDWHAHDDDDGQWSEHEYEAFPSRSDK